MMRGGRAGRDDDPPLGLPPLRPAHAPQAGVNEHAPAFVPRVVQATQAPSAGMNVHACTFVPRVAFDAHTPRVAADAYACGVSNMVIAEDPRFT